jgi:hypothetical protein
MARGCVASLLTRSHASLLGQRGMGVAAWVRRPCCREGRRFFEAPFSSAVAGEIGSFVCSRVRRFAPYPLAR